MPRPRPKAAYGLSEAVMGALREAPDKLTTVELMAATGEDRRRINNAITTLKAKGLIEKEQLGADVRWWLRGRTFGAIEPAPEPSNGNGNGHHEAEGDGAPTKPRRRSPGQVVKIDVDDLRKILGVKEADTILAQIHAATAEPLARANLEATVQFAQGLSVGTAATKALPVLRAYFRLHARGRRAVIDFAEQAMANGGLPQ